MLLETFKLDVTFGKTKKMMMILSKLRSKDDNSTTILRSNEIFCEGKTVTAERLS